MNPTFILTAHASIAMAERAIALAWISRTLAAPLFTEPDRDDPDLTHALLPIAEFGGRMLRVVYNGRTEPWRVVTVYFDRAAGRRL